MCNVGVLTVGIGFRGIAFFTKMVEVIMKALTVAVGFPLELYRGSYKGSRRVSHEGLQWVL